MEAATPLRQPQVRTAGDRLVVDALIVEDEQAVRLVREREQVDEVFGPESGQLSKELDKLFSDGSSASVQNRVRELVADTLAKSREDLVRQFSSEGDRNPLAQFQATTVRELRIARESRERAEQALQERLGELQRELQALRDEK